MKPRRDRIVIDSVIAPIFNNQAVRNHVNRNKLSPSIIHEPVNPPTSNALTGCSIFGVKRTAKTAKATIKIVEIQMYAGNM